VLAQLVALWPGTKTFLMDAMPSEWVADLLSAPASS